MYVCYVCMHILTSSTNDHCVICMHACIHTYIHTYTMHTYIHHAGIGLGHIDHPATRLSTPKLCTNIQKQTYVTHTQQSKTQTCHMHTRSYSYAYIHAPAVGIMEWAMFVVLPSDAQSSKPNVRIFNKAVESSLLHLNKGQTPQVCMYVGDSATLDAQGAASAGLRPILVRCLWAIPVCSYALYVCDCLSKDLPASNSQVFFLERCCKMEAYWAPSPLIS